MSQKQELIAELIPLLREKGYKKKSHTWYKENSDLVIVFNIQHSNYSKDEYYIILGISIKALKKSKGICLNCDITQSVPSKNEKGVFVSSATLIKILDLWEEWYGNLANLRRKAVEGKLPICSTGEAITFLTSVRLG